MSKYTKGNSSNLLISKILKRIGLFNFKTQISNFKLIVFVFNIIILTITLNFSFSTFNSSIAHAAPNYQLNYQGKLTNSSNVAVSDGSYNIRFRLCTDSDCSSVIYTETHCYSPDSGTTCDGTGTDQRVTLTNGLFSTMIGSVVSTLSSLNFNQTLYLGVTVGGSDATPSWDPEMSPRKTLGTVPSSFEAYHSLSSDTATNATNASNSDTLDTYHESSFAFLSGRSGGQTLIGGSSSNDDLTLEGTSDSTRTSSYVIIQPTAGNVGIGTTSPASLLEISDTDANPILTITNKSDSEYDPSIQLKTGSSPVTKYTLGVDDSDSDKFKISTTALGTSDRLIIDSSGNITLGGATTVQGSVSPDSDNDHDLGSAEKRWQDLYLGPASLHIYNLYTDSSNYELANIGFSSNILTISSTKDGAGTLRPIQIQTASNTGIYLDTNGNTGLNTNSPRARTDILDGSSTQLRLTYTDNTIYTDFQTTSSGYLYINPTGSRLGIGTNAPSSTLDVAGNIMLSGENNYINFNSTAGSDGYGFRDNAGTVELKNSGGSWSAIPLAGGSTLYTVTYAAGASGTWTAPTGVYMVYITGVSGGGGGGGSCKTCMSGAVSYGTGAGSGASLKSYNYSVIPGQNYSYSVGTGGTGGAGTTSSCDGTTGSTGGSTIFGSLTLTGGGPGSSCSSSGGTGGGINSLAGKAGGVSSGTLSGGSAFPPTDASNVFAVGTGGSSCANSSCTALSSGGNGGSTLDRSGGAGGIGKTGAGGSSFFGSGGAGVSSLGPGNNGTGYGAGGSGGFANASASNAGGNGSDGFLVIEYVVSSTP